jgi:uncharacterized membrane protein YhaH (DUF805 family)
MEIKTKLKNIFNLNFKGVIGRGDFWLGMLLAWVVTVLVVVVTEAIYEAMELNLEPEIPPIIFALFISMPIFVMFTSLQIRRIRDLGKSGWFFIPYLFVGAIPFVGHFVQIAILCLKTDYFKKPDQN